MDSSASETQGQQQGSAFNGHVGCTCYHPLFVFNQFGDLERVMLRRGNQHSAKFWRRVLLPVIARYRELKIPKFFRGDAAFASPKLMKLVEDENFWYAIRMKANAILERHIVHLLKRPVGHPSKKPKAIYHTFRYQAKLWDRLRRVVAKIEWHAGELFPRVGFVVTNLRRSPKRVIKFYNGRGTAEQWIMEGKYALKWTRLSCRRFRDNQARLPLFALAYNLANFLIELTLPRPIQKDLPGIHDNPCRNLGRSAFEGTTAYLLGAQGARLISNSSRVRLPSRASSNAPVGGGSSNEPRGAGTKGRSSSSTTAPRSAARFSLPPTTWRSRPARSTRRETV